MKIRPVGTELFYADGRTDMTKVIVSFRSFVPKNETLIYVQFFNLCFLLALPYKPWHKKSRRRGNFSEFKVLFELRGLRQCWQDLGLSQG